MLRMCGRCGVYGQHKIYGGSGAYKGRALCPACLKVIKRRKSKIRKRAGRPGRSRAAYLKRVEVRSHENS